MSFWLREFVGWVLVILGLAVFFLTILMLMGGQIFESGAMTVIGVFVFRGGIHLLKVALAARICEQTAAHLRGPILPPARSRMRAG